MFLKVIACEVMFREVCYCAARSVNQLDLGFLSQGYHDNPEIGIQRIQEQVDAVPADQYDGILIGYGLCNHIVTGLRAHHTPVVVPRAHDCITFFLGSRDRYTRTFRDSPGTYYYTAGWIEHRERRGERVERRQGAGLGIQMQYEELAAKYGEDNANYLMETMGNWTAHYKQGLFIGFDFTTHLAARDRAREICESRGWTFKEVQGDLGLLQNWVDGNWRNEDFLVVQPGEVVAPTYDDQIIQIEPPSGA